MHPSAESPTDAGTSKGRRSSARRRLVVWAFSTLTVGGVAWYLWSSADRLLPLIEVPMEQTLGVGLLFAVGTLLNALEFWVLYRRLGARIGVIENWLLYSAGQLLNHAPGQVGTVYRFGYLRTVHRLSYPRAASGYGANLLLTVVSTGALGLVACLAIGVYQGIWSPILLASFAGLLMVSLAALVVPLPTSKGQGRFARAWRGFQSGWSEVTKHTRTALIVVTIEFIKYAILAVRMKLALSWIGIDQSYGFFLVIAAVTGLVTFLALTPAGVGLRELAIGFAASAMGVEFDLALLGATLDRAVMLVWALLIGTLGLVYTARRMAQVSFEQSV